MGRFYSDRSLTAAHDRSNTSYAGIVRDKNAAKPYTLFDGKLVKLEYDNIENIAPCGGINSCSADLANWVLAQLQNGVFDDQQIIPGDVINETRTPRSIVGDGHSGLFPSQHYDLYGLGVEMNDFGGEEMVWHTGGADGFVTTVCMVPGKDIGIVVLTNTDANYFFIAAMYQILEAYFDMPYRNLSALFYGFYTGREKQNTDEMHAMYKKAEKKEPLPLPGSLMTGAFYNPVYGKMFITMEGGNLVMKFEHHPQLKGKLEYMGDNTFVCTYDPISYGVQEIPFTIEDNKVTSVTVTVTEFIDLMPYVFTRL
ncbi:MAG: serine hydrolase [Chitinophagales bacterium]